MSQLSYEEFVDISNQRDKGDRLAPVDQEKKVKTLQLMTKEISKLFAKSWLPEGKEIRKILLSGDDQKILQLFKDNGIEIEILGNIDIELDTDSFLGSLEDTRDNSTPLKLKLAYPPKPSDFNLSDSELEEWVNNENPEQIIPPNPYIPVTW